MYMDGAEMRPDAREMWLLYRRIGEAMRAADGDPQVSSSDSKAVLGKRLQGELHARGLSIGPTWLFDDPGVRLMLDASLGDPSHHPNGAASNDNDRVGSAFGPVLRFIRVKANWTQESLALKCGMDRTSISQLERRITSPTIGTLFRLWRPLGASPALMVAMTVVRLASMEDPGFRIEDPPKPLTNFPYPTDVRGLPTDVESLAAAAFGITVRHLREMKRWSRAQAARAAKVDSTYWGTVERGSSNATLAIALRMAGGLEVTPEFLVRGAEILCFARLRETAVIPFLFDGVEVVA